MAKVVTHDFLKVFYDVTNEFSAYDTPTTNIYFKGVWDIQCMLLETANGPHTFLVDMVKEMQKKFDKYWSDYNMLLSCACVLDPRYKLGFVEYCYTTLYGEVHAKEKVKEVRAMLCELLKEYRDVDGGGVGDSGEISEGRTSISYASSWKNNKQHGVEKSQLDLYLEEMDVDFNSKLDVLV